MASNFSRRMYMVALTMILGITLNVGTAHALLSPSQYNALRDQYRLGAGTSIAAPAPAPVPAPVPVPNPATPGNGGPDSSQTAPDTNKQNAATQQPAAPSGGSYTAPAAAQTGTSRDDYYSRLTSGRSNYYNGFPGYSSPGTTTPGGNVPAPAPAPAPSPAPQPAPAPANPPVTNPGDAGSASAAEQQMLTLVNQERVKAGLPAFKTDSRLVTLARQKSRDMYENNYFSHNSPTYGSPYDMLRKAGISARVMGAENIAKAATVARAHELLMNSAGHRANILDARHDTIGIGIVSTPGGVYVTQLFLGN